MIRHKLSARLLVALMTIAAIMVFIPAQTKADDLNAPPYAGLDNTTVAFWNEITPGAGDLGLTGFDVFPGIYPLSDHDAGSGPGEPDLEIIPVVGGDVFSFFQPNFIDPLPVKEMRIQVTFSGAAPTIDDIVAFDPLGAITVGPLNHVLDIPANPFATGYFYEDWLIFPNPDWEFVEIFVPTNTLLHQVVIDSYSTPEPSTLILFGISALGVVVYGWRRRKRAA